MTDDFYDEVLNLHRFLEDWLTGRVANGGRGPERLAQALSDDFRVIHPDGSRGGKPDVVRAFASAHGSKPAGYALEIGAVETRLIGEDICRATYKERHRGEAGRARVSTAILKRRPGSRNIEWIFLQETPAPHLETGTDRRS